MRQKKKTVLGIFVKTLGLSPIKTRLANDVGKGLAEKLYHLSCQAIESIASDWQDFSGGEVLWVVAEEGGLSHPMWVSFPRVYQGQGSLGERLGRVYDHLHLRYESVLFIGADSPQITPNLLHQGSQLLADKEFVLGMATDGGFWFFGGRKPIPLSLWSTVPYSTCDTFVCLEKALSQLGRVARHTTLSDFDCLADLQAIYRADPKLGTKAQDDFFCVLAQLLTKTS